FGAISEEDIVYRRAPRAMLNDFIAMIHHQSRQNDRDASRELQDVRLDHFAAESKNDEEIVGLFVFWQKAQDLGVTIGDSAVLEWIRSLSYDRVESDQITRIIAQLQFRGQSAGKASLFDDIRMELAAREVSRMLSLKRGLWDLGATPAQRWDYFCRMNRKVKAQLVALPVDDFVDEVPAPSEEVLNQFYEEHKDKIPTPDSMEPGFKLPRRLRFEYLKADWVKFFENAKGEVTEKEIAEEFKKRKDDMRAQLEAELALPADMGITEDKEPADAKSPEKKAGEGKPENEAAEKPAEKKTDAKADDPADKKLEPPRSNGGAEEAAEESKKEEVKSQKGNDDVKKDAAAPKSAEPPAGETSKKRGPAPPEPTLLPEEERLAALAKSKGPRAPEPTLDDAEVLAHFREELITSIANQKAEEAITAALNRAYGQMQRFHEFDWTRWRDEHPKSSPTAGPGFALAKLAKNDEGLTFHRTPPLSAFEAYRDPDLGRALVVTSAAERGQNFVEFAYRQRGFYDPARAKGPDETNKNQYVFWRIDERPESVPEFAQIRDEVLRTWRMSNTAGKNARDLARERADDIARNVRGLNQTLKERFIDDRTMKVVESGAFAWLTRGSTPMGLQFGFPRLSEVEGVEEPGNEFMQSVFRLKDREIGVAMNAPGTVAYIVQVFDEPDSEPETLRREFTSTAYSSVNRQLVELLGLPERLAQMGPAVVSDLEGMDYSRRLFEQLEKEYDLKWERKEGEGTES
ncbi:MAG: hypothetical protein WD176_07710, partial [Pirellulales bacterium]